MRHDGPPEPMVRYHRVVKRNGRLVVMHDDDLVYTPPDFLRPHIRSRSGLQALASRLNTEWADPIRAVMEFEESVK